MADQLDHMAAFLLEEIKQNWAYIRHVEQIRLIHTRLFLIIVGVVVTAFTVLGKLSIGTIFTLNQLKIAIGIGGLFIFIYGLVLGILLTRQKRGYEHYRIVNAEVRKWFVEFHGKPNDHSRFSFEQELAAERTVGQVLSSTFFYWYLLIVSINLFAFTVFIITIFDVKLVSWSLGFVVGLALLFQCWHFVKINKNIKITPG